MKKTYKTPHSEASAIMSSDMILTASVRGKTDGAESDLDEGVIIDTGGSHNAWSKDRGGLWSTGDESDLIYIDSN